MRRATDEDDIYLVTGALGNIAYRIVVRAAGEVILTACGRFQRATTPSITLAVPFQDAAASGARRT